jgi:hypothetical protein
MIATGLSWRMAIGALVLGNAIMGMVITINGRIGARVSLSERISQAVQLTLISSTLHSLCWLVCHLATMRATSWSRPVVRLLSSGSGKIINIFSTRATADTGCC